MGYRGLTVRGDEAYNSVYVQLGDGSFPFVMGSLTKILVLR